jgi:hypothetical protein
MEPSKLARIVAEKGCMFSEPTFPVLFEQMMPDIWRVPYIVTTNFASY